MQVETIDERYQRLKPETTEFEKKNNAEILTPQNIVVEMLDKFEELCPGKLKDKNFKIIEPCCGKGAFLIELYKRRGSLENIFFNDINVVNVQFCNLLFQTNKGTNQDALKINYEDYDLVITNPPYNSILEGSINSKKTQKTESIYQLFCEKFMQSKYQICLIPVKFYHQYKFTKKNQNDIYKINQQIQQHQLYYKIIEDSFIFGQNIEIKVCCYIVDMKYENNIKVDDGLSIINNNNYISALYYGISSSYDYSQQQTQEYNIPCYCSSFKCQYNGVYQGYIKYVKEQDIKHEYKNDYKVVCIQAFRKQLFWFICPPNTICNNSLIGYRGLCLQQAQWLLQRCEQNENVLLQNRTDQNLGQDGLLQIKFNNKEEKIQFENMK